MSSCSDRLPPPIEDAVSGDKILNADSYQIISFALKKKILLPHFIRIDDHQNANFLSRSLLDFAARRSRGIRH